MKKLISLILVAIIIVSCFSITVSAKDPVIAFFEEYGQIYLVTGDVDGNGYTDLSDVTHVLQYVAGWKKILGLPEGRDPGQADVNYDGKVNLRDVSLMLKVIVKYYDLTVCG